MGITIHYQGRIREVERIPAFIDELEDITNSLDWDNQRIDMIVDVDESIPIPEEREETGIRLKGIHITPPECETLSFDFSPSGRLMSFVMLAFGSDTYPDNDFIYMLHTKTQFAGVQTHIAIVSLLRYSEKKYLDLTEVYDEGQYWETNDVDMLASQLDPNARMIAAVKGALERATVPVDLSKDELIQQITNIIQKGLEDLEE
ncbi:MAG: hypothetical protein AAGI23_20190 [Bacteroidota bacterium]